MFFRNYLNDFNYGLLYNNYEEEYLESIDENNFKNIYKLFCQYNFYFIKDIIVNYLEIFELDKEDVEKKILFLKDKLGDKFNYIIGNDMRYLNIFLEK